MKKFFEKHDLFKILFFVILGIGILTWIIPTGAFSGPTFADKGLLRLGIIDFFLTFFYSIYYKLIEVTFLLALGGFYGVLSYTKSYSYLIEKIAKGVRKNKTIFILVVSFLLALFSASATSALIPLIFVPFLISVLKKCNLEKIKIFLVTFGSIFVGMISPIYANGTTSGVGFIKDSLEIGTKDGILWGWIFFIVCYGLLMLFTFMKSEPKKKKVAEEVIDKYEPVEVKRRYPIAFISIMLLIVAVFGIIGYLPWVETFNITIFEEAFTNIMSYKLGDVPIFSYLLGSADPFGAWNLDIIGMIMLVVSFIIAIANKFGVDGFITAYKNGVKKMMKPIFIFVIVNCAFVLAYWSPMTATIVNKWIPTGSNFNLFTLIILTIVSVFLNVDYGFIGYSYVPYIHTVYASRSVATMLILNSVYGVCQFILPTGLLLFFALSYLEISYKDYLKKAWKFILGISGIVLLLQILLIYF